MDETTDTFLWIVIMRFNPYYFILYTNIMADELWKRKFDSEHRTRYKEYRTRIRSPRIGKEN